MLSLRLLKPTIPRHVCSGVVAAVANLRRLICASVLVHLLPLPRRLAYAHACSHCFTQLGVFPALDRDEKESEVHRPLAPLLRPEWMRSRFAPQLLLPAGSPVPSTGESSSKNAGRQMRASPSEVRLDSFKSELLKNRKWQSDHNTIADRKLLFRHETRLQHLSFLLLCRSLPIQLPL